ncbi:MAG: trypsin, partial [Acidobacteria bacterium]
MKKLFLSILILSSLLSVMAGPVEKPPTDKTLSPYFFVKSDNPSVDSLPLKATSAKVTIVGVIADVTVTQEYKNVGETPLEATYIFPGSTRAAVYGMKMTIGKRTLVAKIEERQKARQDYEQARNEGRSASLLEQQRPNVFQMSVANIMPGDVIWVELKYTELLVPTDGVYQFAYPTVVGPRYTEQPDTPEQKDKWTKNPYLHQGEAAPYTFDLSVDISSPIPVQDVLSPSHKINVAFDGPKMAMIQLDKSEKAGGNRDFILNYRLSGKKIQSGLMLYKGKTENFFLLMAEPPKRVRPEEIPARDYVFIVDVSGSMRGFPLDISKALLKKLISSLKPTDTFNVLLFSGGSRVLSPASLPATKENIQRAVTLIDNLRGGGGTRLLPAMKRALALPMNEGVSRSMVVVTDGYVSVEKATFQMIRENLNQSNLFAFGIGTSVNRYLIEGMARAGMGEPFIITNPKEAPAIAEKFRNYIQSPVLTDIKVNFNGFDTYDVEPVSIPDLFAGRPVVVFGKWKGNAAGKVMVTGISGNGKYKAEFKVTDKLARKENAALRYLWARTRIAELSDYAKYGESEIKPTVTELGLKYNLMTAYTSFVAIDTKIRNKDGKMVSVKQPLPLPQGVSDTAVGGGSRKMMLVRRRPSMAIGAPSPQAGMVRESMDQSVVAPPVKPLLPSTSAMAKPFPLKPRVMGLDKLVVTGFDRNLVAKLLKSMEPDLIMCVMNAGERKVHVNVTVQMNPDGSNRLLTTVTNNSGSDALQDCISKKISQLMKKLPRGVSGSFSFDILG